jgi:D-xylose transport system substrate-binding protein
VSVWKDARELGRVAAETAVALASGTEPTAVEGVQQFQTPGGNTVNALFLQPVPITAENLNVVVDAGWITQEELCQGVTGGAAPCN